MRWLITGARGQLGTDLQRVLRAAGVGDADLRAVGSDELDILDRRAVSAAFTDFRPDVVVNTAAYTAVDNAETDRDRLIQVLVNGNRAPRQGISEPRLIDLPVPAPHRDRVVLGYDSLRLHREDPVQVAPAGAPKRRAFLFRRHAELRVELPDIPLS